MNTIKNAYNRVGLFLTLCFLAVVSVVPAHATATNLFDDITAEVNTLGADYGAFLKVVFIALVIPALIYGFVRRGAKKG